MVCDSSEDLSRSLLVGSNFIYLLPPLSLVLARRFAIHTSPLLNPYDLGFVSSSLAIVVASSLYHTCRDPDCTSWCITTFLQAEYTDSLTAFMAAVVFSFLGVAWASSLTWLFIAVLILLPVAVLHLMGVSDGAFALVGVGVVGVILALRWYTNQLHLVSRWWPYAFIVLTLCVVWATLTQYSSVTTLSYEYAHFQWHLATGIGGCAVPWLFAPTPDLDVSQAFRDLDSAEATLLHSNTNKLDTLE